MVFGWFNKTNKEFDELFKYVDSRIDEFSGRLSAFYARLIEFENKLDDFEKLKKRVENCVANIDIVIDVNKKNLSVKKPEKQKKINTATAILNILKDSKNPLDFNSIKDKIKEYDLKSIDVSDKSIKQSIYNLVYAKKISRSKKNGKGIYQIRANTAKQ